MSEAQGTEFKESILYEADTAEILRDGEPRESGRWSGPNNDQTPLPLRDMPCMVPEGISLKGDISRG